jgi:hypothetical protein
VNNIGSYITAVIASLPLTKISILPKGDRKEFNVLLDERLF